MAKAIITIEDLEDDNYVTDVKYEWDKDSEDLDKISAAVTYGYLIHYLFKTGKVNDFLVESETHFKESLTNG